MKRKLIIFGIFLAGVLSVVIAAYGQSQKYIDRLKEADKHIAFLKKVEEAIEIIEKDREKPVSLEFIDVSNLILKVNDYEPPSPFVYDVEGGWGGSPGEAGGVSFDDEEGESWEGEPFGPDELIERVKYVTGDENWPEEPGGFGMIEHHRGKLIVCHTPEMIEKVRNIIKDIERDLPVQISSEVYLLAVKEDYLGELRKKGSSVITPEAVKKILSDTRMKGETELVRTAYLNSYSAQAAYLYNGAIHTYQGDTDTSGAGGLTPIEIFDPIINIFREGLIVGLRADYNKDTKKVNLVAMISLSKLTAIEEHKGIGGGFAEKQEFGVTPCVVETPKVDLQIVSGSADVPEGYGLLLGGSRMKTAQAEQKSFVVLIVPRIQK
jgi:hypothetical protein